MRRAHARLILIAGFLVAGLLRAEEQASPVVFVCEHGSVKSMIAAQWFNRLSAERGLPLRAVSRGVEPDQNIPAGVAENLRKDGFELGGVLPARLQKQDLASATHVVVIGARSPLLDGLPAAPERWDDIPPASTSYEASRDAMRERLGALLDKLARAREKRP
jgi:protein-tyrosine-phosphatase